MALVQVQVQNGSSATDTVTATYGATPTDNNLLIAVYRANTDESTVTPPSGWTRANTVAVTVGHHSIWYKIASSDPAGVTFTATGATLGQLHIYEYSGNDTVSVLDKTASTADSGVTVTSRSSGTTATTSQADEVCIAAISLTGGTTLPSWTNSFGSGQLTTRLASVTLIVSSTGTYETTRSWTTAVRAAGLIATFKAAAAAGGGNNKSGTVSLLGVGN